MNDMKSKLGIDFNQVEHARDVARKIANGVQDFVEGYTTVAVERTLCRLIGIDGVDANAVPLPNVVVEELREKNVLGEGALFFLGNAIVETGLTPQQIAEEIAAGKLDITRLRDFKCVPVLNSFGGDGISTVCASATPLGLTLAPD